MSPAHRRPVSTTRRALLGLAAAAAAVSGGAVGVQQIRKRTGPDTSSLTGSPGPGSSSPPSKQPTTASKPPPQAPKKLGGGPVPAVSGRTMLGSYLSLQNMSYSEAAALRKEQLGRAQRIVHVFYGWGDTLPTRISGMPGNAVPLVSWRGTEYSDILSGRSDDLIARAARRLRSFDRPVMLRWGWEMNGDWYVWSAVKNGEDASGYVESWKRLRRIFEEEGADNVAWVWSPNWNSRPNKSWNQYQSYYPGDDLVDWVAVSGYNLHHESPEAMFDPIYKAYAARKPMMISELGSVDYGGTSKGDWIAKLAAFVVKRPNICAVVWFDTDTHDSYHEKWRVDTNPHSLAAYKAMTQNPRFNG